MNKQTRNIVFIFMFIVLGIMCAGYIMGFAPVYADYEIPNGDINYQTEYFKLLGEYYKLQAEKEDVVYTPVYYTPDWDDCYDLFIKEFLRTPYRGTTGSYAAAFWNYIVVNEIGDYSYLILDEYGVAPYFESGYWESENDTSFYKHHFYEEYFIDISSLTY